MLETEGQQTNKQTNQPTLQSLAPGWRQALKGQTDPSRYPTPRRGCPSLPQVLLSTRDAQNCWKLPWRAWNALHHLQHPMCVPEGLSSVLHTMGQICGVMLVTPIRRVSPTQHPKPHQALPPPVSDPAYTPTERPLLFQKLHLEVLQTWEMEAQGSLQLRIYNQISHI